MGLYNMMWGRNPLAQLIMVAFEIPDIPRFRDVCMYEKDGKHIVEVLARQGSGNREGYKESNEGLAAHPNFVSDKDFDDYDATYNIITFDVTDHPLTKDFVDGQKKYPHEEIISAQTKFTMTLADVEKRAQEMFDDPKEKPKIEKLADDIMKVVDKGGGTVVIDEDGSEIVGDD